MNRTYKEMATLSRDIGGRAPKFNVKYFTKNEVRNALETNKHFTHVCVELGLMRDGSKSPFNAIRNLNKLMVHFRLSSSRLGRQLVSRKLVQCPHCEKKFTINLEIK